ncbi:MAG: PAS domain-containing sensor histidine kinase [Elusimicrobia bacterium]|nr:PAS domain-containing sensor histidine kinase [Elusimicrobiota bacterium]
MPTKSLATEFLPAEREPARIVRRQNSLLLAAPHIKAMLDTVPAMVIILNPSRQMVFCNKSFRAVMGKGNAARLGWRPGELLRCLHAHETPGGCGTTEYCRACGAAQACAAVLEATAAVREYRIRARPPKESWELRVWATPFSHRGERFTIFAMLDIHDENLRKALERIFFHDVLNAAGAMLGYVEMLVEAPPEKAAQYAQILRKVTGRIIEEITAQRELTMLEQGELRPQPVGFQARQAVEDAVQLYAASAAGRNRALRLAPDCEDARLATARPLLMRVLGNMLKNALEAEPPGAVVTAGCRCDGPDAVIFWVHNPSVMPKDSQYQVFQRSFSTKGSGRGLGTYSMKLLGERGLGGKVSFVSSAAEGTVFSLRCPRTLPSGRHRAGARVPKD